jgi:hypothetical protein
LAESISLQKDSQSALAAAQAQQRSYGLAVERLKNKLAEESAARERELVAKNAQLEQWQREFRDATAAREAAERRAARVDELEQQNSALRQNNASLDTMLQQSKMGKEEFLYSVQCANERLKEKLRQSEEDKVELIKVGAQKDWTFCSVYFFFLKKKKTKELERRKRCEQDVQRSDTRREEIVRQLHVVQEELQRALRYKDDWMTEVKVRMTAEEKHSGELTALKEQLEQANAKLRNQSHDRDLAAARGQVSVLQQQVQSLEVSLREEQQRRQMSVVEFQRRNSEQAAEIARLQKIVSESSASLASFVEENRALQQRCVRAEESLKDEARKSASFQLANSQLEKELAVLKSGRSAEVHERVQELLNSSGSMALQLSSSTGKHEHLAASLREAQMQLEEVRGRVAEQEDEVREISETARAWKVRCERAEEQLCKEEEASHTLAAREREKSGALDSARQHVARLETTLQEEQPARDRLSAELAQLQAAHNQLWQKVQNEQRDRAERVAAVEEAVRVLLAAAVRDEETVSRYLQSAKNSALDEAVKATLVRVKSLEEELESVQRKQKTVVAVEQQKEQVKEVVRKGEKEQEEEEEEVVDEEDAMGPQETADFLRANLELRVGVEFERFLVVESHSQAHPFGKTLFLKVDIGRGLCLWVRVFETNGARPTVNSAQGPKPADEEMVFFDEWDLNFHQQEEEVMVVEEDDDVDDEKGQKDDDEGDVDDDDDDDEDDGGGDDGNNDNGDDDEVVNVRGSLPERIVEQNEEEEEEQEEQEEVVVSSKRSRKKKQKNSASPSPSPRQRSSKRGRVDSPAAASPLSESPSARGRKRAYESHYSLRKRDI